MTNSRKPIHPNNELITRKEAIKKAGITALTASSLLLLETKAHAQTSPQSDEMPASPNKSERNPRSGT